MKNEELALPGERGVGADGAREMRQPALAGNRNAAGKAWKSAIRRMITSLPDMHLRESPDTTQVKTIAEDAWAMYVEVMREVADDGVLVRTRVAEMCRHQALETFWTHEAAKAGMLTPDGLRFADRAMKHGARAERLGVVAVELATKLAAGRRAKAGKRRTLADALVLQGRSSLTAPVEVVDVEADSSADVEGAMHTDTDADARTDTDTDADASPPGA
jgi:hypothetical protein